MQGKIIWIITNAAHVPDAPAYHFIPSIKEYEALAIAEEKKSCSQLLKRPRTHQIKNKSALARANFCLQNMMAFLVSLENENLPVTYSKYKALRQALLRGASYSEIKPLILFHDYKGSSTYTKVKARLLEYFEKMPSLSHPLSINKKQFKKNYYRVMDAILDDAKPIIYLVGVTGTSKTHTAKSIAKHLGAALYLGEHKIIEWLENSSQESNQLNILLLDELNLDPTGKYEMFRGLTNNPPTINYQGKTYYLSKMDKVIATGNTTQYKRRHFHSILWDEAHAIRFSPLKPEFIKYKTRKYLSTLQVNENELEEAAELITRAYSVLCAYANSHSEINISLSDIKNICARIPVIMDAPLLLIQAAKQAIVDEVSDLLLPDAKEILYQALGFTPLSCNQFLPDPENFILTEEKKDIWRLLLQDMCLRQERIRKKSNKLGKLGLLLEGPSGIGKSQLLIDALKQAGLSPNAMDPQNRYVQISAGTQDVEDKLLKAFHEGSVVILDELNLDPHLENVLNSLLSNVDPRENKPANNPGFMILANQNPAYYDGCDETPPPVLNRLHKMTMSDYNKRELRYIATRADIYRPHEYVRSYLLAHKKSPDKINARHFFNGIEKMRQEGEFELLSRLINRKES